MRKLIAAAMGAAALAIVPLSLTASPASADPDISQLCSQNNDLQLSHDACVNLLAGLTGNEHNGALYVSVCKLLQQNFTSTFDTRFKNLGQCVSFLIHQPTPTPTPSPSPTASPSPTPMV